MIDLMLIRAATLHPAIKNPIGGASPDFNAFGGDFRNWVLTFILGIWGIAILAAIGFLIRGLVSANIAGKSQHPSQAAEAQHSAKVAAITLGALAGLPVIVGAILTIAGS